MSKLLKATPKLCARGIYRSGNENNGCNYKMITGRSRIFVNGEMSYPKEYCNKFEEGRKISVDTIGWKASNNTLIPPRDWTYEINPFRE